MTSNILTAERLRELLIYEPETGWLMWLPRVAADWRGKVWNTRYAHQRAGHTKSHGYRVIKIDGHPHLEHRLAWLLQHGCYPKDQIDHINGNRADNRLVNLRDVTPSHNKRNTKLPITNTSGVIGVSPSRNYWKSTIRVNRKSIHLGYFDTVEAAANARSLANRDYEFHENHGRISCDE